MRSLYPGTMLATVVMFGWVAIVLILYAILPARRATLVAFIIGFLFLPLSEYKIPQIPVYNKTSATCILALCGKLLFDRTVHREHRQQHAEKVRFVPDQRVGTV